MKTWLRGIFGKKSRQPEDRYQIEITDIFIKVQTPQGILEQIFWNDIENIKLINTDQGPWIPDIWLGLFGEKGSCLILHGTAGFDTIYDRISRYEGFNFEDVAKSMSSTENSEFLLWEKC